MRYTCSFLYLSLYLSLSLVLFSTRFEKVWEGLIGNYSSLWLFASLFSLLFSPLSPLEARFEKVWEGLRRFAKVWLVIRVSLAFARCLLSLFEVRFEEVRVVVSTRRKFGRKVGPGLAREPVRRWFLQWASIGIRFLIISFQMIK